MNVINDILSQIWPLYGQTNFYVTVAVTLLIWYVVALGFAHLTFGAGRKTPVACARQGMWLSLLVMGLALAASAYFLFQPLNLVYMSAITVTFLLLAVVLSLIFSRMGKE
jgi:hypothetical protein